jgi:hypothetical protein
LTSVGALAQASYFLYDVDNDGSVDLVRDTGAGPPYQLVAEGIEAIGFAYAYDADSDGVLDNSNPLDPTSGFILWAVDSDNDNFLDQTLDANNDGIIDLVDDINNNTILDDGPKLLTPVPVDRIRAVRVWLQCRSTRTAHKVVSDNTLAPIVIGDRIITPPNDNVRRRTVEMSIICRNLKT